MRGTKGWMRKKTPRPVGHAPRLFSRSIGERMNNTSSSRLWWLVVPSIWACHISAVAQEEIYQGPVPYNFQSQVVGTTSPGSAQSGTPFMGTSSLAGSPLNVGNSLSTRPSLVEWGPFRVYPQISYLFTYGNGLEAEPGINSTTAINTVTPDMLIKIGQAWTLDYAPSLDYYSNPLFHNTTDQRVVLAGGMTYGNWTLNLSQSYIDTTDPLVETGTQVEQEVYATALNAAWQMNGHLSLQLGLNQNFRFAQAYIDLHEWTTSDWLNYQFERQLGVAIGVTGGYDEVSLGSDMPFEEAQGRVSFQPGPKLSLSATGGIEDRQFIHPSAPALVTPIFNATAQYQASAGTTLTVSGGRTVTPTFYGNEIQVVTSVSGGIRQHIVGKTFLSINGSYVSEPFTSIVAASPYYFGVPPSTSVAQTRSDTFTNIRVTLSTAFRSHLTGSIFYSRSDNSSSQIDYSYTGNQVGLQLNYQF